MKGVAPGPLAARGETPQHAKRALSVLRTPFQKIYYKYFFVVALPSKNFFCSCPHRSFGKCGVANSGKLNLPNGATEGMCSHFGIPG